MLTAISRYGARVLDNTEEIAAGCKARGEFIEGPHIAQFEAAFARRHGMEPQHAITASYGRMAFHYILKAFDFPPGSEIIFPALTFWVMPAVAKGLGLKVVFADVDPATFNLDPAAFERAITPNTRAVVPTHLYGLPCDMDAILGIARRHDLRVIEDCAHALGATYDGRPVGAFGDAAIFSFQTLKPLNLYGGGLALVRGRALAVTSASSPTPSVAGRKTHYEPSALRAPPAHLHQAVGVHDQHVSDPVGGRVDRRQPRCIPVGEDPAARPTARRVHRALSQRQAAIGLEALKKLDDWTEQTRAHAHAMDRALADLPGISVPTVPPKRTHVYYQYCVYGPQRDELVVKCVRKGIDIETLHVDVCPEMEMFADAPVEPAGVPGAVKAAGAMQVPVYSSLTDAQIRRVARVVRDVLTHAAT